MIVNEIELDREMFRVICGEELDFASLRFTENVLSKTFQVFRNAC